MLDISLLEVLGAAAITLCWVLAVVLFRVGSAGSVARKLAMLLAVEGLALVTSGIVFDFLSPAVQPSWESPSVAYSFTVHTFADCLMLALYPPFLAATLKTRLTRPFLGKGARVTLLVLSFILFLAVELSPLEVGASLLYGSLSLVFGYAMVASIHAWIVAPAGIARTRAGIFVLGFGIRDICWGFVYGSAIYRIAIGVYSTVDDPEYVYHIYRISTLVYVPIIAYGILRTQLFDIDLRLRWTIKQSTLAATVVAIMFLISEGADRMLSSTLGETAGLWAAAIVVFFLAPLQRFAERIASVAMPNTKDTPEYASFRKMQVYESALTEALLEGGISDKERTLLTHLRESLGVSEANAQAIEHELQTSQISMA